MARMLEPLLLVQIWKPCLKLSINVDNVEASAFQRCGQGTGQCNNEIMSSELGQGTATSTISASSSMEEMVKHQCEEAFCRVNCRGEHSASMTVHYTTNVVVKCTRPR